MRSSEGTSGFAFPGMLWFRNGIFSRCFTWCFAEQKQSVSSECCPIERKEKSWDFPFGNPSRGRFFYMDLGSFSFYFFFKLFFSHSIV